jgi:hypothetical protein
MAGFLTTYFKFEFQMLSPVIDPSGWGMVYQSNSTTGTGADWSTIANALATSMSTTPTGGSFSPQHYLSTCVDGGANKATITAYDITNHLDGSPHGPPIGFVSFTVTPASGTFPEGICAVITLQAPYGTDVEFGGTPPGTTRPRARDRGRIYFGPFGSTGAGNESVTNRCIISAACRTDLTKWIHTINQITVGANTWSLGVWSRKNAGVKALSECWVDDRPDYQRRRSDQATTRTIQALP